MKLIPSPVRPRKTGVYEVAESDMRGLAIRLDLLETHYRKPKDFTETGINRSARTLRRWYAAAIPNDGAVPIPILLALADDLNTPLAVAEMHRLAKTDGRGLFAAMKLLGLVPGHGKALDLDIVDEVKTLPIDAIPLVEWARPTQ